MPPHRAKDVAPVETVRRHSGKEEKCQRRGELRQAHQAQIQRIAGLQIDLPADRDGDDLGPHHVQQPGTDIIDWIETIPFNETRNYVQRVIEGLYVYRARIAGVAGPMTIEQYLARGVR